ncbi:MAG: response regulator [Desulfobacterales bacterium]|nr:response regulator [Desulfobacterales bacterium]
MAIIPYVKIAVIEPDKLIRDFIVDVLAFSVNRKVYAFDNCVDAINYLSTIGSADVILIEANLPHGSSGLDLLKELKNKYAHKLCIVMSDNLIHEEKSKNIGADAFLAKPFTLNDLFDIVQSFVVEKDWRKSQPQSQY